jgi:hypothetical protein
MLATGIFSLLLWRWTRDLRLYGWVQFFPCLALSLLHERKAKARKFARQSRFFELAHEIGAIHSRCIARLSAILSLDKRNCRLP